MHSDFIANAGGVICAAMEYRGATESEVFRFITEKISTNTKEVLERVRRDRVIPRQAAVALATERIRRAMGLRRWSIY